MASGTNIRTHGTAEHEIHEERTVDNPDLRLAEFVAPTQHKCISLLRDRLLASLEEFGINCEHGEMQRTMAVEESLANAFYHGNLELDSALKEDGSDRFAELARERSQKEPWQNRRVRITELATPFGLWITIRDEGSGFDVQAALKRIEDPDPLALLASGRGLIMMKEFTDALIFNPDGNEVTLVFYNKCNQDIAELLEERARLRGASGGEALTE
ncbi:MAG: ATP-binding protein [Planctomycetaceae bacterium]